MTGTLPNAPENIYLDPYRFSEIDWFGLGAIERHRCAEAAMKDAALLYSATGPRIGVYADILFGLCIKRVRVQVTRRAVMTASEWMITLGSHAA
ncbi:hypothetical protein [Actinomadura sp. 6N118]|uniref:hypothetical protein n=1 Tax=Actinomadura sp. 6N118 TaxID=3375151 RepID=UPI00378B70FB